MSNLLKFKIFIDFTFFFFYLNVFETFLVTNIYYKLFIRSILDWYKF